MLTFIFAVSHLKLTSFGSKVSFVFGPFHKTKVSFADFVIFFIYECTEILQISCVAFSTSCVWDLPFVVFLRPVYILLACWPPVYSLLYISYDICSKNSSFISFIYSTISVIITIEAKVEFDNEFVYCFLGCFVSS